MIIDQNSPDVSPEEKPTAPAKKKMVRMKRQPEHYVNNKEFSQAVVDYVLLVNEAREAKKNEPRITEYIGTCFLKIAEGLSHKPNFIRYTYREEMVMDGVENCIKAIMNYNVAAATRSGLPNAFAYFTQICYYAFIRRIMKEKKQQDIKMRYIEHAGIEDFMSASDDAGHTLGSESVFIDSLKHRIDKVKNADKSIREFAGKKKKNLKQSSPVALEEFMPTE